MNRIEDIISEIKELPKANDPRPYGLIEFGRRQTIAHSFIIHKFLQVGGMLAVTEDGTRTIRGGKQVDCTYIVAILYNFEEDVMVSGFFRLDDDKGVRIFDKFMAVSTCLEEYERLLEWIKDGRSEFNLHKVIKKHRELLKSAPHASAV